MRHRYIVCYDIADPKRLNRVFRKLHGFGDPVQYSVFCCDLSPVERLLMEGVLRELINQREDRVMLINVGPVGGRGSINIAFIGRPLTLVDQRQAVIV